MTEKPNYIAYIKNLLAGERHGYMIKTFGCQMNESDSEKLAGVLESLGYTPVETESESSIIIFNTCCVRESAEQKIFGHLGEMKKFKQENKNLIIGLCGCMTQQPQIVEKIKKSYHYADIVFGSNSMHKLPELLYDRLVEKKRQFDVTEDWDVVEGIPVLRGNSLKAYVPIMHGCNNFCSYCIVPYVRGREKSRNPSEILNEIRDLAEKGTREIMLLGQNVNSYRGGIGFSGLLNEVSNIKEIRRVRFMTSHPKDLGTDVLEAIAANESLCNQLHLPLQSGSSRILNLMNRGYTRESYLGIIEEAKRIIPGIGLSTDIIVGFPGETEEDFLETLDVVEKARFDFAYTFIYSPRKGTPAAEMFDPVPENIKHERFNRLLEVQNNITLELNRSCIGQVEEVLVEGRSKTNEKTLTGRTGSNKIVNFYSDCDRKSDFAKIKITDAGTWHLEGELLEWM
ncbi:MAG: tRNA (N6-isopentenyl adenosine(37)-C2)-methylthiotransferase MiaB [Clostridia bacterium]|nr:tRNA (N6-isopentenyl adenosine(37)-C2)-methylthiotransferase MiaB [Clostridia bacterium]